MARKVDLTPALVDAAQPPVQGDVWIPDLRVRGFGLRLWAGPNGGGRAFCLRAKTTTGRYTRRHFQPHVDAKAPFFVDKQDMLPFYTSLGVWVDLARQWAEDEKRRLLGQLTEAEKHHQNWEAKRRKAAANSLRVHLHNHLEAHPGQAGAYRDQMFALLRYVPETLLDRAVDDISERDLVSALVQAGRPLSAIQKLRGLMSRSIRSMEVGGVGVPLLAEYNQRDFDAALRDIWATHQVARYRHLAGFRAAVFQALAQEQGQWVEAALLRVYFQTTASQAALLCARWSQITPDRFLPAGHEALSDLQWWHAHCQISPELDEFLQTYRARVQARFGETPFVFPSPSGGHVTSVQRYWRTLARRCGVLDAHGQTVTLSEFGRAISYERRWERSFRSGVFLGEGRSLSF